MSYRMESIGLMVHGKKEALVTLEISRLSILILWKKMENSIKCLKYCELID